MKQVIFALLVLALGVFLWKRHTLATGNYAGNMEAKVPEAQRPTLEPARSSTPVPSASVRLKSKPIVIQHESATTSKPIELTAEQESSLSESRAHEEEWSNRREDFIKKHLGLRPEQIDAIERLREETEVKEAALVKSPVSSPEERDRVRAEIFDNRREYASGLARLLGKSGASEYSAFYREYWGLPSGQSLISPHLPL